MYCLSAGVILSFIVFDYWALQEEHINFAGFAVDLVGNIAQIVICLFAVGKFNRAEKL